MERQQVQGKIEVMDADTPDVLFRETTFIMDILKSCLAVQEAPSKQNNSNSGSGTPQGPGFSNIEFPSSEVTN